LKLFAKFSIGRIKGSRELFSLPISGPLRSTDGSLGTADQSNVAKEVKTRIFLTLSAKLSRPIIPWPDEIIIILKNYICFLFNRLLVYFG